MKMDSDCEESVCKIYQVIDGKWNLREHRYNDIEEREGVGVGVGWGRGSGVQKKQWSS